MFGLRLMTIFGPFMAGEIPLALDDYDPEEWIGFISEIMAEDDPKDPYLESYQEYRK